MEKESIPPDRGKSKRSEQDEEIMETEINGKRNKETEEENERLKRRKLIENPNNEASVSIEKNEEKNKYAETDQGPYFVFIQNLEGNIGRLHKVGTARLIINSAPEIKNNIINMTVVGKNRVKVELNSSKSANILVNSQILKEKRYEAYIPTFLTQRKGVIKEVDLELSEKELAKIIESRYGNNLEILNVKRMVRKKDNELVPTSTIIVTFRGQIVPNQVIIEKLIYNVELYVPRVIQCIKCMRYGHVMDNCRGTLRCRHCGENHETDVCEKTSEPICILCGGDHSATDRKNCPEFDTQKKIKKIMVTETIPYNEAKEKVEKSYANVVLDRTSNVGHRFTSYKSQYRYKNITSNAESSGYSQQHKSILETPKITSHPVYEKYPNIPEYSEQNFTQSQNNIHQQKSKIEELCSIILTSFKELLTNKNLQSAEDSIETWLKKHLRPNFNGYHLFRSDREDGFGGVGILLKKNIAFNNTKIFKSIENLMTVSLSVKVSNSFTLNVYSIYAKPKLNISERNWTLFFESLEKPFILAGDFNCHHQVWGCDITDRAGINLLSAIENCNLVFLNNGAETLIPTLNQKNKSAIDISIVSPDLATLCNWQTKITSLGSNHFPILIEIKSDNDIINTNKNRWNLNKANWSLFSESIEQGINQNNIKGYDKFIAEVNKAAGHSIPKKKKVINSKFNKHWWNEECDILMKNQKDALLRFKQNSNAVNYICLQRAMALCKRLIKKRKKESWKNFCTSINKNTPITQIWTEVRKLKNIYKEPVSKVVAGEWTTIFINQVTPPWVAEEEEAYPRQVENINTIEMGSLLKKFSLKELQNSIKKHKNTAPGMDNIHYVMLYNLPLSCKITLLEIINNIWETTQYPEDWKKYIMIPMLKPQKDPKLAESYRGISLASCVLKTFERMIKTRMEYWLESNLKLPKYQFGFRKAHSTIENITHLVADINISFSLNRSTIALFMDIEAAYNKVNLEILHRQMTRIGFSYEFSTKIIKLYRNRIINFKVNEEILDTRTTSLGLPQGSVLSPLLYTIYTFDLERLSDEFRDIKILEYADDICIYIDNCDLESGYSSLNQFFLQFNEWCHEKGLNISLKKSKSCIFTRKRAVPNQIVLQEHSFPVTSHVTYLGVTIDRKLLWKEHIERILKKAEKGLNILRAVSSYSWGADPEMSLLLYRSFIRSILDYGSFLYSQAASSNLKKIDNLVNKCLRLSIGAFKSTPVSNLYVECCEMPLQLRRKYLCNKFLWKILSKNSSLVSKLHNLFIMDLTNKYWKKKESLILCESYKDCLEYKDTMYRNEMLPIYQTNLTDVPELEIRFLRDYSMYPNSLRNMMFNSDIENYFKNHHIVFTDASKKDDKTSCAFWDPIENYFEAKKLPSEFSSYSAEQIGLLSWDLNECLVDLEKELAIITEQALEGEEARYGERLIQFASENLVTEILIHPAVSTLAQCMRNLLSSFTRHRHIIHAGYTFAANGSWALQDGTFSYVDFSEAFQELEVQRVVRAYENGISMDIHCAPEGDWPRLPKEPHSKACKVHINPTDVLTSGSPAISAFVEYLSPFLVPTALENLLESSDVVGNIRFSRPTLYVFPGGQGDAALFGINGFNMLLDGGYSRKACFWDFVRHLDRLDAVLMTRLNNSNVGGISSVLRRKKQDALYPQIGHFFCNIQERKAILSPDGDKDKDPLLINLLEEGQEIISNLRHLNLNPQVCYRDSEPINLYHKVGHGTLDMYVLSPAKDSKEVREFLLKWNHSDQKLFANAKSSRDFSFPVQNLISISALLVWRPANPTDTITRILYPGSCPQNKILEGLDRLKNLDFIKHPVCSEKSLVPISTTKKTAKEAIFDRIITKEKPTVEKKENKLIENDLPAVNGDIKEKEKIVKKSDSTESDKSTKTKKQDEQKIIENGDKPKTKPKAQKPRGESQQRRKPADKKSPTMAKKPVENGDVRKVTKQSPLTTPAKSAKDANNRKVLESKVKKEVAKPPVTTEPKPKVEKAEKVERKPISRRPPAKKAPISPAKKIVNGVQKPDSISRKGKLDKEGTTDSSTVSTPSADQESVLKKDISKLTPDEFQQMKAQELAELKEEQEAVKEIEAVFRKGEVRKDDDEALRKVKEVSIDDKLDTEEYLIIEKEEIEQLSLEEKETKDENLKLARDSEESEKQRKSSKEEQELEKQEIQKQLAAVQAEQEEPTKAKDEPVQTSKVTSPEEKVDVSTDKKVTDKEPDEEVKDVGESQPDEKVSATVKSGDTTTAPTLPEDERIPLDEIKEDIGPIEEKYVKEETKEKEVPTIQVPPKTFDTVSKLPSVVGIRLDKQQHIRDIVKTPDEVADLPVHEEVDYEYTHELKAETPKSNDIIEKKDEPTKEIDAGFSKEKAKEEETEKDKDEVVILEEDSKKAMQDELKTLTDIVLKSESILEKDILKESEKKLSQELEDTKEIEDTAVEKEKDKDEAVPLEEIDKDEDKKEVEEATTRRKRSLQYSEMPKEEKPADTAVEEKQDVVVQENVAEEQLEKQHDEEKKQDDEEKDKDEAEVKALESIPSVKEVQEELVKTTEQLVQETKESTEELKKIEDKLNSLKEALVEPEIVTEKAAEDTTLEDIEKVEILAGVDKLELGRKSPKEREGDVMKIVAGVAEVLKSDAPLEEFEKKIPITTYSTYSTPYTQELRETHITTVDSPTIEMKVINTDIPTIPEEPHNIIASFLNEERKIAPVHDGTPESTSPKGQSTSPEDKKKNLLKESQELMMATSKMLSDIKSGKSEEKLEAEEVTDKEKTEVIESEEKEKDEGKETEDEEKPEEDVGTVHRMLVTASSEDGGEEIEICPVGTITFSRSSESSGRSSPDPSHKVSQKSSIVDTISDTLSTVRQVGELHSEKDSGIDDANEEGQEKTIAPEQQSKESDATAVEKTEELPLSGKSSPDVKDASIKSIASGKSTPDLSDFDKSKEISAVEDGRKEDDLGILDKLGKKIEDTLTTVEKLIHPTKDDDATIKPQIDEEKVERKSSVAEIGDKIEKVFEETSYDITATPDTKDVNEKLTTQIDDLSQKTDLKLDKEPVTESTAAIIKTELDDKKVGLLEDLDHKLDDVEKSVKEITSGIEKKRDSISDKGKDLEREIDDHVIKTKDDIIDHLEDKVEKLTKDIEHPVVQDSGHVLDAAKELKEETVEKTQDIKISATEAVDDKDKKDEAREELLKKTELVDLVKETKDDITKTIEEQISEVHHEKSQLKESQDQIVQDIKDKKEDIQVTTQDIGKDIEESVIKKTDELLETTVGIKEAAKDDKEEIVSSIDTMVEDKGKDTKESLTKQEDIVAKEIKSAVETAKDLATALVQEKDDVLQDIKTIQDSSKDLKEEVSKTVSEIEKGFEEEKEETQKDLKETEESLSKKIEDVISEKKEDLLEIVKSSKEDVTDTKEDLDKDKDDLDDHLIQDKFAVVIDKTKREEKIEDISQKKVEDIIDKKEIKEIPAIQEHAKDESAHIEDVKDKLEHQIDIKEEIEDVINQQIQIEEKVLDITKEIKDKGEQKDISDDIKTTKESKDKLIEKEGELAEDIKEQKDKAQDIVQESLKDAEDFISKKKEDLVEASKDIKEDLIVDELKDKTHDVKKSVEESIKDISDDLPEETDKIKEEIKDIKDVSKVSISDTVHEIEETKDKISKDITDKQQEIETVAHGIVNDIEEDISKQKDNLFDSVRKVEETTEEEKLKLDATITEVCKDLKDTAEDKKEHVSTVIDDLHDKTDKLSDDIKDKSKDIKDAVKDTFSAFTEKTAGLFGSIKDTFKEKHEEVKSDVTETLDGLSTKKDEVIQEINDTKQKIESDIHDSVKETASEISKQKDDVIEDIKGTMVEKIENLKSAVDNIDEKKDELVEHIKEKNEDIAKAVGDTIKDSEEFLTQTKMSVLESLPDGKDVKHTIETNIKEPAKDIIDEISEMKDSVLEGIKDAMLQTTQDVKEEVETVDAKKVEIVDSLKDMKQDIVKDLREGIKEADEFLTQKKLDTVEAVKDMASTVEYKQEEIKDITAKKHDELTEKADKVLEDVKKGLEETKQELKDAAASKTEEIKEITFKKHDELTEKTDKALEDVKKELKDTKDALEDAFDSKKEEIKGVTATKHDELKGKAEEVVEDVKKELDDTKDDLEDTVKSKKAEIQDAIVKKHDELTEKADEASKDFKKELEDTKDAFHETVEALTDKKQQLVEDLQGTKKDIESDIHAALIATEKEKDNVVDAVKDIKEELQNEFSDGVKDIKEDIDKTMDNIVDTKKEISTGLVDAIKDLTEKKEELVEDGKEKGDKIKATIEDKAESLKADTTNVLTDLAEKKDNLLEDLKDKQEDIKSSVKEVKEDVQMGITDSLKDLAGKKDAIIDGIKDKHEDIMSSVKEVKEEVKAGITDCLKDLGVKKDAIIDDIKDKHEEIKSSLQETKEEVKIGITDSLKDLAEKKDAIIDDIKDKHEEITSSMKEVKEEVKAGITDSLKDLAEKKDVIIDDIKDKHEEIKSSVQEAKEEVKMGITDSLKDLAEKKGAIIDDVKDKHEAIKSSVQEVKIGITDSLKDLSEKKDAVVEDVHATIQEVKTDIKDTAKDVSVKKDELFGAIEDKKEKIKSSIQDTQTHLADHLEEKAAEVSDGLKHTQAEIKSTVQDTISTTRDSLTQIKDELSDTALKGKELIHEENGKLKETVEAAVTEKEEALEKAFDKVALAVSETGIDTSKDLHTEIEEQKTTHAVSDTKDSICSSIKDIEDQILEAKDNTKQMIQDKVCDLETAKDNLVKDVKDKVGDALKEKEDDLIQAKKGVTESCKEMKESVQHAVQEKVDDVLKKTEEICDGVKDAKADIVDKKEELKKEYQEKCDDLTQNLEQEIKDVEEGSHGIIDSIDKGISETLESISSSGKSLFSIEEKSDKKETPTSKDKEEKSPSEKETMDEKVLKKEQILEEAAGDLEDTFKTVIDMTQSVIFDKCDKPFEDELSEEEESVKEKEKLLDKLTDDVEETFETVEKMARRLSFEKCDTHTKEEEALHEKEKLLDKLTDDVEETFETVEKMARRLSFEKCDTHTKEEEALHEKEKLLDKLTDDVEETFETVKKMARRLSFEKCDTHTKEEEALQEKEKLLDKLTDDVEETFETVEKMARRLSFEKCDTHTKEEERLKEEEKLLDKLTDDVKETVETVEKMARRLSFEKCDTHTKEEERLKEEEKLLDKLTDDVEQTVETVEKMARRLSFEKCDTHTKEEERLKEKEKLLDKLTDDVEETFEIVEKMARRLSFEKCDPHTKEEEALKEKEKLLDKLTDDVEETFETVDKMARRLSFEKCDTHPKKEEEDLQKSRVAVTLTEKHESEDIKEKSSLETESKVTEKGEKETMEKDKEVRSLPHVHTDTSDKVETTKIDKPEHKTVEICDNKQDSMKTVPLSVASTSLKKESEELEKQKQLQDNLLHEKQFPGRRTPPTAPVSPNITDDVKFSGTSDPLGKESHSDLEHLSSLTDVSSEQYSRHGFDRDSDDEEEQYSITSQVAHSRDSSQADFDVLRNQDPMSMSFYGALPDEEPVEELHDISKEKLSASSADKTDSTKSDEKTQGPSTSGKKDPIESWGKPLELPAPTYLYEITNAKYSVTSQRQVTGIHHRQLPTSSSRPSEKMDMMTTSFYGQLPDDDMDPIHSWGKPLGLPSPAAPNDNKGTPKKERKLPANVTAKNKLNDDKKRAESPSKYNKNKKINPVYVDLTYVPHHGNAYYAYVDFFRRVRARYYVFSGIEPSREVYNALLEAKQTWEDKELEVTIIPTYDTDILGYWVAENEELLTKFKIDLSPSASRCTINLQDHETSCSAYRLEF